MTKKSNIIINKVYTKKGDSGKTDLIGKKKVSKSNLRVDCYGEVDELNSSLGICRALIEDNQTLLGNSKSIFDKIIKIQNNLFNLGTMLAVSDNNLSDNFPKINSSDIVFIEKQIDLFNKDNNKYRQLNKTIDCINERYGEFTLASANLLNRTDMPNVISPAWKPYGHRQTIFHTYKKNNKIIKKIFKLNKNS